MPFSANESSPGSLKKVLEDLPSLYTHSDEQPPKAGFSKSHIVHGNIMNYDEQSVQNFHASQLPKPSEIA